MARHRKKSAKQVTRDAEQFYQMIGACITTWANVDEELFRIFRRCVGPLEQSAIIYFKTPSLEVRRTLTEELVYSVLPKTRSGDQPHPSVKAWKEASKSFQELSKIRGQIAHHRMSYLVDPMKFTEPGAKREDTEWFQLYLTFGQEHRKRDAGKPLKYRDLVQHLEGVLQLSIALNRFGRDVLPKHVGESPPRLPPPS